MTDLLVIVPSRGRPQAMAELALAFVATCTADTAIMFAVDDSDPTRDAYLDAVSDVSSDRVDMGWYGSRSMVECLNRAAMQALAAEDPAPYAVAFMGDDHRPRTRGWDARYLETLRQMGTGIVYGDDLVQGERLPTQVAMTADIVRALGWMAPPVLHHMYVDNFWRDLGVHAGCIRYLPDVVVEHLHPIAGTAETDAGYERVNAPEVYDRDQAAYRQFCESGAFRAAVDTVRAFRPDVKLARLIGMARASFVAEAAYLTQARTVADIAEHPTDLAYLLGPALQVRSQPDPLAADVVCVTDLEPLRGAMAGAAVVMCGSVELPPGFTSLRVRMIGNYPITLAVRA